MLLEFLVARSGSVDGQALASSLSKKEISAQPLLFERLQIFEGFFFFFLCCFLLYFQRVDHTRSLYMLSSTYQSF